MQNDLSMEHVKKNFTLPAAIGKLLDSFALDELQDGKGHGTIVSAGILALLAVDKNARNRLIDAAHALKLPHKTLDDAKIEASIALSIFAEHRADDLPLISPPLRHAALKKSPRPSGRDPRGLK